MSFHGQHGIMCDGPECGYKTTNPDVAWNTLAAEDGSNYYFCDLVCLAEWTDAKIENGVI